MPKNLSWRLVMLTMLAVAGEGGPGASLTPGGTQLSRGQAAAQTQATALEPVAASQAAGATQPARQPAEPAKLHCQVFNQAGMGIANATVEANLLGPVGWVRLATEETGRMGECDVRFGGPAVPLLQLKVSARGYKDAETLYLPRPSDVVAWLTIALKGAKSLEGRVVTEDRKGVDGATVAMDTPAGLLHTQTSVDGAFWFDNLMPMNAVLVVQVPGTGVGAYRVDLTGESVKPIEIVLHAQRRVTLRVVGDRGKALPGVMVEVLAPQPGNSVTDGNGKIQINGVGSGSGRVAVSLHDDFYRLDGEAIDLPIDEGSEPVELEITATCGGLVEGQVVEKQSGEPIPAAVVWFVDRGKLGPNVTCDVDGKFKFEAIPEDDYLLAAGHATYSFAVARAGVEAGKKTSLRFALANGASIQGVVLDPAGKGAPRAIVRAATWVPREMAEQVRSGKVKPLQIPWRAVRADPEGQYLLENLPGGRIRLEFANQDGGNPATVDVEVPDDNTVMEMALHLQVKQSKPPM